MVDDGPVGGPHVGQRGIVKVEPSPQAKQQTPQASDLDAAIYWEMPTTGELVMETHSMIRTAKDHRLDMPQSAHGKQLDATRHCGC